MTEVPVPEKPFRVRIGENVIDVRPDPDELGKSLLIINGVVHRGDFRVSRSRRMSTTNARDVVIVLMSSVCLRWLSENQGTVGEMTDHFLTLLDQEGYEIVRKGS